MKKITIATILATILINFIQAQNADVNYIEKKKDNDSSELKPADIKASAKAEKDFSRSRKGAENIQWYVVPEGSLVRYTLNEKQGKRFYNKKGNFLHDILTYSEESLPLYVKDMVKRTYYSDYNITLAQEIHSEGKIIYVVQIENKSTLKILRIVDDEMEVLNEYNIQKLLIQQL
jgi:hypothetical protein